MTYTEEQKIANARAVIGSFACLVRDVWCGLARRGIMDDEMDNECEEFLRVLWEEFEDRKLSFSINNVFNKFSNSSKWIQEYRRFIEKNDDFIARSLENARNITEH